MTPSRQQMYTWSFQWSQATPEKRARLARNIGHRFEDEQSYRQAVARVRTFPNPLQEMWDFVQQKVEESEEAALSTQWEWV